MGNDTGAVYDPAEEDKPIPDPVLHVCVNCNEGKPISHYRRAAYGSHNKRCNECRALARAGEIPRVKDMPHASKT